MTDGVLSQILETAHREAHARGRNFVGSEHLLLALLTRRDEPVVELLGRIGVNYDGFGRELEAMLPREGAATTNSVGEVLTPLTPAAGRAVQVAVSSAHQLRALARHLLAERGVPAVIVDQLTTATGLPPGTLQAVRAELARLDDG